MKRFLSMAYFLCILFFYITPTQASLIVTDYAFHGDGLIVRDTNTGLDWLKLTETTNISYNEMLTKLTPGGDFYGFRYARVSDIDQLQISAGLPAGLFFTASTFYKSLIDDLINLVGATQASSTNSFSYGLTSDPFDPTTGIDDRIIRGFALTLGGSAVQAVYDDNLAGQSVGSWLIRDSIDTAVSQQIPTPSAVFLILSGILLLRTCIWRR